MICFAATITCEVRLSSGKHRRINCSHSSHPPSGANSVLTAVVRSVLRENHAARLVGVWGQVQPDRENGARVRRIDLTVTALHVYITAVYLHETPEQRHAVAGALFSRRARSAHIVADIKKTGQDGRRNADAMINKFYKDISPDVTSKN